MAFPAFQNHAYREDGSSVTSHPVDYPTSIASGDLLLFVLAADESRTWTDFPSGFNTITNTANGTAVKLMVLYKIADGTESGTFNITSNANERGFFYIARITGWHGTTAPETGTAATGNNTTPDPPSCTPSWGAEDTLWVACYAADAASTLQIATDGPTNYQLNEFFDGAEVSGAATIGVAYRELNGTTDDPGIFTCAGTGDQWVAQTVAIRPAAAGGGATLHTLSLLGVGK